MYLPIFNSFRVIRSLSQCVTPKIAILQHFCFPWGRPWGNHAKCCMNGKKIRCLQIVLQHVLMYLQQLPRYSNRKCKKTPFPRTAAHIFVSPGDAPATITQYVVWMERQFNACQTTRSMCLSIFNSFRVMRCLRQCVSPKIAIFTTFLFPLGTPLQGGNHAACCMDGKRIRCLQIVSQHVPMYLQQFPRYSNRKCIKNAIFTYRRPHMLHGWKDNSMLAKPLAACAYLSTIVSELYDA